MFDPRHGVLLISGLRTHQENYASLFQSDSRCRIIAMSDEPDVGRERAEWNRMLAEEFNIPLVPDLDEALQMPGVDIVSVCAEPERRARVVAKCARAGKHVYIDKPMTPYLAAADDAVRAVEESGVRSQMFSFISKAWCRRARSIVDSGELGELEAIHADWLFGKGPTGFGRSDEEARSAIPVRPFFLRRLKGRILRHRSLRPGAHMLAGQRPRSLRLWLHQKLLFRCPPKERAGGFWRRFPPARKWNRLNCNGWENRLDEPSRLGRK